MFITFEGIEGSGKSTLLALMAEELKKQNKQVVVTMEPGGTAYGAEIRKLLFAGDNMDSLCELLLFLADRADHVKKIISPALREEKIVLCDRFTDSTIAYQGYGRKQDVQKVCLLCESVVTFEPDLTFLLDLPVRTALKRVARRNGAASASNRFDEEDIAFYQRVREGYLRLEEVYHERFFKLDAKKSPEKLLDDCMETLDLFNLAHYASLQEARMDDAPKIDLPEKLEVYGMKLAAGGLVFEKGIDKSIASIKTPFNVAPRSISGSKLLPYSIDIDLGNPDLMHCAILRMEGKPGAFFQLMFEGEPKFIAYAPNELIYTQAMGYFAKLCLNVNESSALFDNWMIND